MGSIIPGPTRPIPAEQLDADGTTLDVNSIPDGDLAGRSGTAVQGVSRAGADTTAFHTTVSGEINGLTAKNTPVLADLFTIEDSAASFGKKSLSFSDLQSALSLTESQISDLDHTDADAFHTNVSEEILNLSTKGSPVAADSLLIENSEASYAKWNIQIGTIPVTESQISDLDHTDTDAFHTDVSAEVSALTGKTTPSAGDFLLLEDSAASFAKRSTTYGNFEAALSITESQVSDLNHTDTDAIHDNVAGEISAVSAKTDIVDDDVVIIEDSEAGNAKKSATVGDLLKSLSGFTSTLPHAVVTLSADQTSNITAGNRVEYNTIAGPLADDGKVTLTSGTGQQLGGVTFKGGHSYLIVATCRVNFSSSSGNLRIQFVETQDGSSISDHTLSGVQPNEMRWVGGSSTSAWGQGNASAFVLTPTNDLKIQNEFATVNSVNNIEDGSGLVIVQLDGVPAAVQAKDTGLWVPAIPAPVVVGSTVTSFTVGSGLSLDADGEWLMPFDMRLATGTSHTPRLGLRGDFVNTNYSSAGDYEGTPIKDTDELLLFAGLSSGDLTGEVRLSKRPGRPTRIWWHATHRNSLGESFNVVGGAHDDATADLGEINLGSDVSNRILAGTEAMLYKRVKPGPLGVAIATELNDKGQTTVVAPAAFAVPDGLELSYVSVSQVELAAGLCADDTRQRLIDIKSAVTLDITTSGAGGLDTGTEASSTWYYVHGIYGVGETDTAILSASKTAPTLPSGYTHSRYLGAVYNDASGNFLNFRQHGRGKDRQIQYDNPEGDTEFATASGATSDISMIYVPPHVRRASIMLLLVPAASGHRVSFRSPNGDVNGWHARFETQASDHDRFGPVDVYPQNGDIHMANSNSGNDVTLWVISYWDEL